MHIFLSLFQAAQAFENGLVELLGWIEYQKEDLESMPAPDEDASVLQEQIEENNVIIRFVWQHQFGFSLLLHHTCTCICVHTNTIKCM